MTSVKSIIIINNLPLASKLDMPVHKLTPDEKAAMESNWKSQFLRPVGKPDNHPDYIYAQVKVGGQIVATIYNGGGAMTTNADHTKLRTLPSMSESETETGLALAQKRAEEIAAALGGRIEKIATPDSIAAWQNRAPITWAYDEKAMAAQSITARTVYHAQLLGQGNIAEMGVLLKEES